MSVAAALDEFVGLDAEALSAHTDALTRANDARDLPARSRRQLLQIWERLDPDDGVPRALAALATYVPLAELRADLDALSVTGAERASDLRVATLYGIRAAHEPAHLEVLRTLATELDGLARAEADSLEARTLLFEAVHRFDVLDFTHAVMLLVLLPPGASPLPADDDLGVTSQLATLVTYLAERSRLDLLRLFARQLSKIGLTGRALESVLARLVAVSLVSGDREMLEDLLPLVPGEITWDLLAYNLACASARARDRDATLRFTGRALALGRPPDRFLAARDFAAFARDAAFLALLDAHR